MMLTINLSFDQAHHGNVVVEDKTLIITFISNSKEDEQSTAIRRNRFHFALSLYTDIGNDIDYGEINFDSVSKNPSHSQTGYSIFLKFTHSVDRDLFDRIFSNPGIKKLIEAKSLFNLLSVAYASLPNKENSEDENNCIAKFEILAKQLNADLAVFKKETDDFGELIDHAMIAHETIYQNQQKETLKEDEKKNFEDRWKNKLEQFANHENSIRTKLAVCKKLISELKDHLQIENEELSTQLEKKPHLLLFSDKNFQHLVKNLSQSQPYLFFTSSSLLKEFFDWMKIAKVPQRRIYEDIFIERPRNFFFNDMSVNPETIADRRKATELTNEALRRAELEEKIFAIEAAPIAQPLPQQATFYLRASKSFKNLKALLFDKKEQKKENPSAITKKMEYKN